MLCYVVSWIWNWITTNVKIVTCRFISTSFNDRMRLKSGKKHHVSTLTYKFLILCISVLLKFPLDARRLKSFFMNGNLGHALLDCKCNLICLLLKFPFDANICDFIIWKCGSCYFHKRGVMWMLYEWSWWVIVQLGVCLMKAKFEVEFAPQ